MSKIMIKMMNIVMRFSVVAAVLLLIACQPKFSKEVTKEERKDEEITPIKGIDTAKDALYMTERERAMIKEINLVRSNPEGYIPMVEAYMEDQKASLKNVISGKKYILDEIETAKELIRELKKTPPMAILMPHEGMYKGAKKHGQEGKRKGSLDHKGKDGSWPWDRIEKYAGLNSGGENLVGGLSGVREAVMTLLVDSGVKGRGHRKILLDPNWTYVACYEVGTVGDMPYYWVQNFGD